MKHCQALVIGLFCILYVSTGVVARRNDATFEKQNIESFLQMKATRRSSAAGESPMGNMMKNKKATRQEEAKEMSDGLYKRLKAQLATLCEPCPAVQAVLVLQFNGNHHV